MRLDISKARKWNMADTVTSVRIAASAILVFLTPISPAFLAVYTLAGVTDALDGWLARRAGTVSDFGARLDSIADLIFYGAVLIRLVPILRQAMPGEIWYVAAGALLLRLAAYCTAAVKYRRFASLHTYMNKLTGAAVFLLPYILVFSTGVVYGWIICALGCAASSEELAIHLCREEYCADIKTIFQKENHKCA